MKTKILIGCLLLFANWSFGQEIEKKIKKEILGTWYLYDDDTTIWTFSKDQNLQIKEGADSKTYVYDIDDLTKCNFEIKVENGSHLLTIKDGLGNTHCYSLTLQIYDTYYAISLQHLVKGWTLILEKDI